MKHKNLLGVFSLLLFGAFFGALLVLSFGWSRPSPESLIIGAKSKPVQQVNFSVKEFNKAFEKAAAGVTPSIVRITVVSTSTENPHKGLPFLIPFNNKPFKQRGGGSGIIISKDGYILTNNHVVKDAIEVKVGLFDRREFEANIIGTDPLTDIAVIKIDANNLPVAFLGNSDKLKVGTWVMAIGNPLALSSTVTAGIISAVDRNLKLIKDSYGVEDYIQTDAAINPGNSGGALVDLSGAVIGVNTAIATNGLTSSYIGYGFAIPINLAKVVAKDLIAFGKVNRGYIGVNISDVDAPTARALGLNKPRGIIIQDVLKGSAAENADIKVGDVILKADDKIINRTNELQSYIATHRAGDIITLTLFRDGKIISRKVKLKQRNKLKEQTASSQKAKTPEKKLKPETVSFKKIGLTVRNATPKELKQYKSENGIFIEKVESFSIAEDQGLAPGEIIFKVQNKIVKNTEDFQKILNNNRGKSILLKIAFPDGTTRLIGLDVPKNKEE